MYFIRTLQESFQRGSFDKDPDIKDMAETLLLQKTAYSVDTVDLTQRLLDQDDKNLCQKVVKKAETKVAEIKDILKAWKRGLVDYRFTKERHCICKI